MHEDLGPERFHQRDFERGAAGDRLGREPQPFRTDADADLSAGARDAGNREQGYGRAHAGALGAGDELAVEQVEARARQKLGHEQGGGRAVDFERSPDLLEPAVVQDGEPVGERHRLDLVVRHVERRHAEPPLQLLELGPCVGADLGVEVRQRLVHQEQRGLADDGASERDALLLPARQLMRLARDERLDPEHARDARDPPRDLLTRHAVTLEAERQIVPHRHVRIERVILEYHGDVARLGRDFGDVVAVEHDGPRVERGEPRHRAQQGGLAAAGWTEQDEQLALEHLDVETAQHGGVAVRLDDPG